MFYDGTKLRWANRRMHTANVVFGEVRYDLNGVCGPRTQRDFELVILHSGSCRVSLNEALCKLQPGTVYLFRPGGREHFGFASDTETHHGYCSIRPQFIPGHLKRRLEKAPFAAPCTDVFRMLLATVAKLRVPRNRATRDLVDQLGLCAFAEFLNASREAEDRESGNPPLRKFLHYVEDHFGEQECLQAARQATGVCHNSLICKFKKEMNTTPARYLWKFRLERGAAMLLETGHTVAEIAYRCGFQTPFHFSRLIKQLFGQSPKELRRRAWASRSGT